MALRTTHQRSMRPFPRLSIEDFRLMVGAAVSRCEETSGFPALPSRGSGRFDLDNYLRRMIARHSIFVIAGAFESIGSKLTWVRLERSAI